MQTYGCVIYGNNLTVVGDHNTVYGDYNVAMGTENRVLGQDSEIRVSSVLLTRPVMRFATDYLVQYQRLKRQVARQAIRET